jgi:hypothetical protein
MRDINLVKFLLTLSIAFRFRVFPYRTPPNRPLYFPGKKYPPPNALSGFFFTSRTGKPRLLKVKTGMGGSTVTLKIRARRLKSGFITKKAAGFRPAADKPAVRGFFRSAVKDGSAEKRCKSLMVLVL